MKGVTITIGGVQEVKNKVCYRGVDCIYVDKGFGEYWIKPLSPNGNIEGLAGMGKTITKKQLDRLLKNKNNKP